MNVTSSRYGAREVEVRAREKWTTLTVSCVVLKFLAKREDGRSGLKWYAAAAAAAAVGRGQVGTLQAPLSQENKFS